MSYSQIQLPSKKLRDRGFNRFVETDGVVQMHEHVTIFVYGIETITIEATVLKNRSDRNRSVVSSYCAFGIKPSTLVITCL